MPLAPLVAGAAVGVLGGLVGLGGAEFRLPLLLGVFGFAALQAVVLNKAVSLVVVVAALPARLGAVPLEQLTVRWPVVATLLAGTLPGAWVGATWAVRARAAVLHRVLAVLLVVMAVALVGTHAGTLPALDLSGAVRVPAGVAAGLAIGAVAAVMGVAGGELLIPTLVLLFAVDVEVAGSLSLVVSLPTMLVALARYRRDGSFSVLRASRRFVLLMSTGSVLGAVLGGALLGVVSAAVVVPLLGVLLLLSALRVWRH